MSITDKMRKAFDVCTVMAGVEPDFECVYMTKDAALLYLDEIDAENAKLRSELESVGTAAYLYGRSDLQAENATLGAGTCKADETDVIKCWVKCKDEPSVERMELIHVMECSACGGTYEYVNGSYEYCPRCGRRIVQ